jgi:hypothetical protein
MVYIEDVDGVRSLIDPIDDSVSAASSAEAACQRSGRGLTDPMRVIGESDRAELDDGSGDRFGQANRDRAPGG